MECGDSIGSQRRRLCIRYGQAGTARERWVARYGCICQFSGSRLSAIDKRTGIKNSPGTIDSPISWRHATLHSGSCLYQNIVQFPDSAISAVSMPISQAVTVSRSGLLAEIRIGAGNFRNRGARVCRFGVHDQGRTDSSP